MAQERIPDEVSFIPTGYANVHSGEIGFAAQRPREQSDVRTKCSRCPAYVDGKPESGREWLRLHMESHHKGS